MDYKVHHRANQWEMHEDQLLVETVLKEIKEGGTQLRAFQEVGEQLNRTASACGFRFNAVLRHHFVKEIAEAKHERVIKKARVNPGYRISIKATEVVDPAKVKSTPQGEYSFVGLDNNEVAALHSLLEASNNPDLKWLKDTVRRLYHNLEN